MRNDRRFSEVILTRLLERIDNQFTEVSQLAAYEVRLKAAGCPRYKGPEDYLLVMQDDKVDEGLDNREGRIQFSTEHDLSGFAEVVYGFNEEGVRFEVNSLVIVDGKVSDEEKETFEASYFNNLGDLLNDVARKLAPAIAYAVEQVVCHLEQEAKRA